MANTFKNGYLDITNIKTNYLYKYLMVVLLIVLTLRITNVDGSSSDTIGTADVIDGSP